MREIKFRAWSKAMKQMYDMKGIKKLGRSENKEYVLLQYTGLKDKNGKEIYEGDILHFFRREKRTECRAEVCYGRGGWVARQIDGFGDGFGLAMWACDEKNSEIIGNIYKNPELLKRTE